MDIPAKIMISYKERYDGLETFWANLLKINLKFNLSS